jgi:hypothetical protein
MEEKTVEIGLSYKSFGNITFANKFFGMQTCKQMHRWSCVSCN